MKQRDAQVQSDFRAMRAEFEKRQAEWVEKVCIDKEKSDAAIRVEQQQSKESEAKWMAFVQQLQDDHVKCQKEADDDHVHCATEIEKQHVQQEERHTEQQWRLRLQPPLQTQVSPPAPPPHVQVHVPPPLPSQLNMLPPAPPPCHLVILLNMLPQAPVVDFAQR